MTIAEFESRVHAQVCSSFPAEPFYERSTLSRPGIPGDVASRLDVQLDRHIDSEVDTLFSFDSPWINLNGEGVKKTRAEFKRELARASGIPQHAWESELREAIEITVSYLITPLATINRVISEFAVEPRKESARGRQFTDDLHNALRSFSAYPHILSAASAWIDSTSRQSFDHSTFSTALKKADREESSVFEGPAWSELLQPLNTLLGIANPERNGFPVPMLIDFFEERGTERIVEGLRNLESANTWLDSSGAWLLPEHLAEAIDSWLHEVSPVSAEVDAQPSLFDRTTVQPPTDSTSIHSDSHAVDGNIPLWKTFAGEAKEEEGSATEQPEVAHAGEPLWKRFQRNELGNGGAPDAASDTIDTSLERADKVTEETEFLVLGDARTRRHEFVRDLFDGEEDVYLDVLRHIQLADSWKSASEILAREVFRKYDVDIYSELAVALTNAIEEHFKHAS